MKLSVSNIGWGEEDDKRVYELMHQYGYTGLEIAPTRIFPENPYEDLVKAGKWIDGLKSSQGFVVPSMQSIWYGRTERIFGTDEERNLLTLYTKKAIDFAETIGCANLVFGCPRNRSLPEGGDTEAAIRFFKELGDYAYEHHTVIAMEANPPIYNTNFINTTEDAISLIERVDSKGFLLNLDIGTMIENDESTDVLEGRINLINHIHVSEPGLKQIQERTLHQELAKMLRKNQYERFISIEAGRQDEVGILAEMMKYVRETFG